MMLRKQKVLNAIRVLRQPHRVPIIYFSFLLLGGVFTLFSIFQSKSEISSAVFLGYSWEKVLLGAGILFLLLVLVFITIKLLREPAWAVENYKTAIANEYLLWIFTFSFLICWVILFLPEYRLSSMAGYVSQLKPVIVWLAVVSAGTMLLFLLARKTDKSVSQSGSTVLWGSIIVIILFLLSSIWVIFTGVGIAHPEDYWYASGVPLLGLQILFAFVVGGWVLWAESKWPHIHLRNNLDLWICLALWLLTAWLWAREPIRPNFFMPDTLKNVMYPYSDSATFDIGSQFALIGQGIFNGQYFDRALYISFLTYLHAWFGQNTEQILTTQAIIFAVFPAIIYLIGRELHSRALGISAALLLMLRGLNSLVSAIWIDLASPKMILTDFAAAIGVAVFTLLAVKWVKEPEKKHLAILAGGTLGMTMMLRTNVLLLLPAFLFIVWIGLRPRWNYLTVGSLLLILGMLTATTPWDLRNRQNGTPMFYVYYSRIYEVLRARYGVNEDAYIPPSTEMVAEWADAQAGGRNVDRQRNTPVLESKNCDTMLCKVTNHFFHNFITSILFLPTSFTLDDLWNTIKLSTPYWKNSWRGDGLGLNTGVLLFMNMAIISLGFGAIWARNKITSLIPVGFFLAYIFSNALALTSGGRYIVPVDWIICIYYMAGLLQIAVWGLRRAGSQINLEPAMPVVETPAALPKLFSAFALIVFLGSLVPASEMLFERRYPTRSVDETLIMLEQEGMFTQTDINKEDLSAFLASPQAQIFTGRLLYPRFYPAGEGELDKHYPYLPLPYKRFVFITIGPGGRQNIIIAGDHSEYITHASDVVVIGCKNELNTDGLIVFVLSEPRQVYYRTPYPDWACPLPPP